MRIPGLLREDADEKNSTRATRRTVSQVRQRVSLVSTPSNSRCTNVFDVPPDVDIGFDLEPLREPRVAREFSTPQTMRSGRKGHATNTHCLPPETPQSPRRSY